MVMVAQLTSKGNKHDELDFEFLGNREGKPISLQTNVFAGGVGNREQRVILWFDPSADFHNYRILWNQHQIVYEFIISSPPLFFVLHCLISLYMNLRTYGLNPGRN